MKFFKHYKNKPYRYIGIAKHSETLEDVVLYETRYENQLAKLWVRPKDMFHSQVELNGASVPRFKEIPLEIKTSTTIGTADIDAIGAVMKAAFGEWDPKWFHGTFKNHQSFLLLTAHVEGELVAFKLGYELNPREFYSWLGGVDPDYRGLGIAGDLMRAQHLWCKEHGYLKVQTKTQNRFREMLLLNLRFGFDVVGFHDSSEGGAKIVLEKVL